MHRSVSFFVGVVGFCAVAGSSAVEEEWAKPVAPAPAPVAAPTPKTPVTPLTSTTTAPKPASKLPNREGCSRKAQCSSGHCCFTVAGSICAASCTFADTGMPGSEDRCESPSDCGKGQSCVVRATAGSSVFKVCASR